MLRCNIIKGIFVSWPEGEIPMKQRLVRLDRIAGEMNVWLLLIAIGLGLLDLAVLIAKSVPAAPAPPAATSAAGHADAGLLSLLRLAHSQS
jgi:hypothetical protein